ncbi:hypothetical protein D3C72_2281210 [compost metagenome]
MALVALLEVFGAEVDGSSSKVSGVSSTVAQALRMNDNKIKPKKARMGDSVIATILSEF